MKSDDKTFSTIVNQYNELLYWHIRRLVVSHEDSQDVLLGGLSAIALFAAAVVVPDYAIHQQNARIEAEIESIMLSCYENDIYLQLLDEE